jgi:hypothetical protein
MPDWLPRLAHRFPDRPEFVEINRNKDLLNRERVYGYPYASNQPDIQGTLEDHPGGGQRHRGVTGWRE